MTSLPGFAVFHKNITSFPLNERPTFQILSVLHLDVSGSLFAAYASVLIIVEAKTAPSSTAKPAKSVTQFLSVP